MPALLVSLLFAGSMSAGSIEVVNELKVNLEIILVEASGHYLPIDVFASEITTIPNADVNNIKISIRGLGETELSIDDKVDSKWRITVSRYEIVKEEILD